MAIKYSILKRFFDLFFSVLLLFSLFFFMAIFFFVLSYTLRQNPIFVQQRIGKNNTPFLIYKFKTMVGDIVPNKLCLVMRKLAIDELPQLWNIILGDMSFVGPRPLLPEYLPLYSVQQQQRHLVLPGLTGLAQIKGGNMLSWEKRLALDVKYVQNQSFKLDLSILLATILVFTTKKSSHFSESFTGNN